MEVKLNIGCGSTDFGSDWIHIDKMKLPHIEFHNIEKLDFRDNSVDLIYASHVIEYFDRDEVIDLLREWKRVLKKGGKLRIAVPDFKKMVNLYYEQGYKLNDFLGPLYGKIEYNNEIIYHKTCYDFEELNSLLTTLGFKSIDYWSWKDIEPNCNIDDQSQAYLPHMDKENGILISLNLECRK